ncbi:UNVERIFIED_CONTAM: hypothetical protein K2H54_035571 [Gekko kuhli]
MTGWVPDPKCYKKCTLPLLDHGVFFDTKPTYIIWEHLQYSCNSCYLTPGGSRNGTIQCIPDGWSPQPRCMEANGIPLAPQLLHGRYSTTQKVFKLNEVLQYECDDGYQSAGGNTVDGVRCGPEGWLSTPKCTKTGCSTLNPVEHGGLRPRKGSYKEGDVVQFFCVEDYSLRGSELIQCYYFGWYPEPPVCEARRNKCPPPPQPPNAKLLSNLRTYQHGDVVRLECEPHFQIRGAAEVQCEHGKWTPPPKCMGQLPARTDHRELEDVGRETSSLKNDGSCRSPPPVENGFILGLLLTSYETGFSVEYECFRYHLLKGSGTVRCEQGNWTELPVCLDPYENCGSPPVVENGVAVESLTTDSAYRLTITYSCHEYHVLQGFMTVSCLNGQWTTPPVCIEPCTLSKDEMEEKNLDLVWSFDNRPYYLHGEFIQFICKPGYFSPSNSPSDFRAKCWNGQLSYPVCIVRSS